MQTFLGSLRSFVLTIDIINGTLLKSLENNICTYSLPSFYMEDTVATEER